MEKTLAERDTTQVERARIQATRQEVEDIARSDREERDRQRAHAAELATEKRRAEIRKALGKPDTRIFWEEGHFCFQERQGSEIFHFFCESLTANTALYSGDEIICLNFAGKLVRDDIVFKRG